jgi:hypothetical protein
VSATCEMPRREPSRDGCAWHPCHRYATVTRFDLGGADWPLCKEHEQEGDARGYWTARQGEVPTDAQWYPDGHGGMVQRVRLYGTLYTLRAEQCGGLWASRLFSGPAATTMVNETRWLCHLTMAEAMVAAERLVPGDDALGEVRMLRAQLREAKAERAAFAAE